VLICNTYMAYISRHCVGKTKYTAEINRQGAENRKTSLYSK